MEPPSSGFRHATLDRNLFHRPPHQKQFNLFLGLGFDFYSFWIYFNPLLSFCLAILWVLFSL